MARNAEVDRLLDELIKHCDDPDDLLGERGLLKQLTAGGWWNGCSRARCPRARCPRARCPST